MRYFAAVTALSLIAALSTAQAQVTVPPPGGRTGSMVTGIVGDDVKPTTLTWKTLNCPPGQVVAGIIAREGGWMSKITVVCGAPTAAGGWTAIPQVAGSIGGDTGTHNARLVCPNDSWMSGLSGQRAFVTYSGFTKREFLASPVVFCGKAGSAVTSSVSDRDFKPQTGSGGATYVGDPGQYCPKKTFAQSIEVAVATDHHPDIKSAKLHCAALPS